MSQKVDWTEAERRSFAIVPETCDEIDNALGAIGFGGAEMVSNELISYGIEPTRKMLDAIAAIFAKSICMQKADARDVIHYKATFPLRAALIASIERDMIAAGEVVTPNHYPHWITEGLACMEIRKNRRAAEAAKAQA